LPSLPIPRGVRQASMVRASIIEALRIRRKTWQP